MQEKQKHYYDQHTKQLNQLKEGQQVRVRDKKNMDWRIKGVVRQALDDRTPRSYVIQTENGANMRRNRRDLLEDNTGHHMDIWEDDTNSLHSENNNVIHEPEENRIEAETEMDPQAEQEMDPQAEQEMDPQAEQLVTEPRRTRSGRIVKHPERLIERR